VPEQGEGEHKGPGLGATLGGVIVAAALIAGGIWLVNELADSARYAKCAAARHRNCDAIDYRSAPVPPQ
jgi:hypothetical protein